jgi:hypothetical protein
MSIQSKNLAQSEYLRLTDQLARKLAVTETILRNRAQFFAEIRDQVGLPAKIQALFVSSIAFMAIYGGVMGSTHSLWQALSSAIKMPLLFLVTSIICLPTLYFFNTLFGARLTLSQTLTLILTPLTVIAILLFSFAPITLFFLLTTSGYQFFKLLNVAFFSVSGAIGMTFFAYGMRTVSTAAEQTPGTRRLILLIWIILFAFVGSQMAWTLRPLIGYPNAPFELIRQFGGNFYTDILASIGEFLGFIIRR